MKATEEKYFNCFTPEFATVKLQYIREISFYNFFREKFNSKAMSSFKIISLARNVSRFAVFQPRNVNLLRHYATKIDPPKKKSSTLKMLLIGVKH